MKKVFWIIFALTIFIKSEAQKVDDNRIVVTLDEQYRYSFASLYELNKIEWEF